LGGTVSGASLAFFLMDFQQLESGEAMGAGEIELLFNFITHGLPP